MIGFEYDGAKYYYGKNVQGDIVKIYNASGTEIVSYKYDAWGKVLSVTGSEASGIGALNPFRYRSYYYDTETGFYYLQSRYYDPEVGRFLNADRFLNGNGDLLGYNLFAYCSNNPVVRVDSSGEGFKQLFNVDDGDGDPYDEMLAEINGGVTSAYNEYTMLGAQTTTLYRSVSAAEALDIKETGRFNLSDTGMDCKQFGFDLNETRQFGNMMEQDIIVSAEIPTDMLKQFYTGGVDTSIFRAGTLTVYSTHLDMFNRVVHATIKFIS